MESIGGPNIDAGVVVSVSETEIDATKQTDAPVPSAIGKDIPSTIASRIFESTRKAAPFSVKMRVRYRGTVALAAVKSALVRKVVAVTVLQMRE